jgi:hypothetical protein
VLVASVQNIQVRDAAWAAITCAEAERHIDLWRQVARLVGGGPALPVLGLLGMAAWIAGQGALANLVLDRAAGTVGSADYTLFELVETVLRVGVNPGEWDRLRGVLADTVCGWTGERGPRLDVRCNVTRATCHPEAEPWWGLSFGRGPAETFFRSPVFEVQARRYCRELQGLTGVVPNEECDGSWT